MDVLQQNFKHRIDRLHERALRIAYDDYSSDFEGLHVKDNAVTIHKRNLSALAIEIHKISNNLLPFFARGMITELCIPYNTRSTTKVEEDDSGSFYCIKKSNYEIPSTKTVTHGLESIRYPGPKVWKLIPDELKELKSLELFKQKVQKFEI